MASGNNLSFINPTLAFQVGDIEKLPVIDLSKNVDEVRVLGSRLRSFSEKDWNAYERSWDFQSLPLLTASTDSRRTDR